MKTIRYITTITLLSSTLFFTACVPYNDYATYNNSGYTSPVVSRTYIGIYDYPRYLDRPYYFYNNRYYYGGYYRNGYYYHRGYRYRHGHYYHRGYRYHHRRHNQNVRVLRGDDRYKYKKSTYKHSSKKNNRYQRNRDKNIDRLRR